jgi:hypothetical protein
MEMIQPRLEVLDFIIIQVHFHMEMPVLAVQVDFRGITQPPPQALMGKQDITEFIF